MEFGPEIKVDGKRPEWLGDDVLVFPKWPLWSCFDQGVLACKIDPDAWKDTIAIRLPASHPHYTTPTPDERAVAPELVERMRKLVVRVSEGYLPQREYCIEARAILAALEPVDPMLLEARQVVADLYTGGNVSHLREQALSGDGDEWFHTKVARAALARGRQLEKEGK